MLPLQFLLLTVRPVVVMQLRHRGAGGIDLRIVRDIILLLDVSCLVCRVPPSGDRDAFACLAVQTEWELSGLDSGYAPDSFDLAVRGSLYADRSRRASRMKGHLEISITCVLPPALRIVPENVLRGVAESVRN